MTWRLAKSLDKLRREVNAAHPDRPKGADGTIGDPRHAATQSDHNPLEPHPGVVTAWDITTAPFCDALAEKLRAMGKAGDGRVKYIIWKGRICSSRDGWAWRPYAGYSPHFDHIHVSVSDDPAQYDRTDPWLAEPPVPTQPYHPEDDVIFIVIAEKTHYVTNLLVKRPVHSGAEERAIKAAGVRSLTLPEADVLAIPNQPRS